MTDDLRPLTDDSRPGDPVLLLLIRHAQAAVQDPERYPDDALRPLVPKGRKIQRRVSRTLRKRGPVPSRIFSSPWKRAWQTAGIVADETGAGRSRRFACEALAAPPDLAEIAIGIGRVEPGETIALVGHEPWMSSLAALLLTGSPSGVRIDFPKSGVMGIETAGWESGGGTLEFFLTP
jgi:phosphohistidine phosphatase